MEVVRNSPEIAATWASMMTGGAAGVQRPPMRLSRCARKRLPTAGLSTPTMTFGFPSQVSQVSR